MSFDERLEKIREKRKLTFNELAQIINVKIDDGAWPHSLASYLQRLEFYYVQTYIDRSKNLSRPGVYQKHKGSCPPNNSDACQWG